MSQLVIDEIKQNCVLYTSGAIRIDNVILSYPHLDERWSKVDPKTGKKPPEKYSLTALLPKDTHEEARALIEQVIRKVIASKKGIIVGKAGWFLRDGEDTGKPGYDDKWTVNASETKEVTIRDKNGNAMRDAKGKLNVEPRDILDMFYPGCVVSILVRPWLQDNEYGKKVNAGLVGVKFMGDGDRLGGEQMDDSGAWDDEGAPTTTTRTSPRATATALDEEDDEM